MVIEHDKIGDIWLELLHALVIHGDVVQPRGHTCHELQHVQLVLKNGRNNIITSQTRGLAYRFMVAEWLWIWFGRSDVVSIAQYNKNIAQFSDDGLTFNGAYGKPVHAQWQAVQDLLGVDPHSRQAIIQIYRPPTGPTKDVPCTLAVQFLLRHNTLNVIVNMRSSDVWLGLPYDIFTFSMLGNIMAAQLGVGLGSVTMNLGSSHLYEVNILKAGEVLSTPDDVGTAYSPQFTLAPPSWLETVLITRRGIPHTAMRPWSSYAHALCGETTAAALSFLETSTWA